MDADELKQAVLAEMEVQQEDSLLRGQCCFRCRWRSSFRIV